MSDDKTMRQEVQEALAPLLPTTWRLMPYAKDIGPISQPVVMLHMDSITRLAQAPQGVYATSFTITVLDPMTDAARVWGVLDDEVLTLIQAIDGIGFIDWSEARPVVFENTFGWDITTTVITKRKA